MIQIFAPDNVVQAAEAQEKANKQRAAAGMGRLYISSKQIDYFFVFQFFVMMKHVIEKCNDKRKKKKIIIIININKMWLSHMC